MGWWEDGKGNLLGDEALDIFEDLLYRLTQAYVSEHGRKPSLAEVLATMTAVLANDPGEFVSESPGLRVTEIVARTKPRNRKALRPGDVFSVPLSGGEHAFGRLTPQLSVIDFFEVKSSRRVRPSKLLTYPTFRFPALVMLDPLKEGRWRAFDNVPYGDFEIQPFRIGGQIECGTKESNGFVDPSSALRPGTASELQAVPEHSLWNAELVEMKLRDRLALAPKV